METTVELIEQRQAILVQIGQLGPMRMGSVCEQYLPVRRADGSIARRGPYLTYTFKDGGKTRGRHLRDEREARLYRGQIQNWRRYQELSAQLVRISHRLADLELQEEAAGDGKKNSGRRSPPSSRPRRRG